MSTTTHLSPFGSPVLHSSTRLPRRHHAPAERPTSRRPDLERQSITFTIGLYLFICTALLGTHVIAARGLPTEPAPAVTTTAPADATSSGTSRPSVQRDVTP